MTKVYKLIEINEYERLKQLEETMSAKPSSSFISDNDSSSEVKDHCELVVKSSPESDESNKIVSTNIQKCQKSFKDCDWLTFEDSFVITDGQKIYRKKILKHKN